eukprot:TRINITY_DN5379_c0_g2_i1.p1 TRINITY_DN5379_c0_g2~~TRINITY_DN5379_c0_g2_i1.p1  ORF type:complete len:519 (+),score=66.88 TRINITY_DN5379_c0_g2_i1:78-1634(+)
MKKVGGGEKKMIEASVHNRQKSAERKGQTATTPLVRPDEEVKNTSLVSLDLEKGEGGEGTLDGFAEAQKGYYSVRMNRVLIVTWVAYAAYIIGRKPFSVVRFNVQEEIKLSSMMSSMVDTAFLTTYCFGQIFYSYLKNKYSTKAIISLGLAGSAACALLFSSTTYPTAMVFLWGLNGVFESFGWPSCVSVVTPWLAPHERGRIMGVWGSCQAVGSLLGNWLAASLLIWGWRWSYYGVVATVGASAIGVYLLLSEHPNRSNFVSPAQYVQGYRWESLSECHETTIDGEKIPSANAKEDDPLPNPTQHTLTTWQLAGLPCAMDIAMSYFCQKLIRYSLLSWLPYYLTKELGYSAVMAGYVASSFDFGGIIGSMASGVFSDWHQGGKRRIGACVIYLQLGAGSLLLFSVMKTPMIASVTVTCFISSLVGFFFFGCDTLMTGATLQDLAERLNIPQHAGSLSGFVGGIGSIGAILQGPVTAYLADTYGWSSVFYFLVVLSFFAIAFMARPVLIERRSTAGTV